MMDNAKAKAVLVAMDPDDISITPMVLHCSFPLIETHEKPGGGPVGVKLDGSFSADELEAIVAWMRDPKGVSEA